MSMCKIEQLALSDNDLCEKKIFLKCVYLAGRRKQIPNWLNVSPRRGNGGE